MMLTELPLSLLSIMTIYKELLGSSISFVCCSDLICFHPPGYVQKRPQTEDLWQRTIAKGVHEGGEQLHTTCSDRRTTEDRIVRAYLFTCL